MEANVRKGRLECGLFSFSHPSQSSPYIFSILVLMACAKEGYRLRMVEWKRVARLGCSLFTFVLLQLLNTRKIYACLFFLHQAWCQILLCLKKMTLEEMLGVSGRNV